MNLKRMLAFVAAVAAATSFAQDEEDDAAEESAEATTEAKAAPAGEKRDVKWFFTLPVCKTIQVGAQVMKPNAKTWESAEEGRFYPLGTAFRAAAGGKLVMAFGNEAFVEVENGGSFATRAQGLSDPSRTIALTGGEVSVKLPGMLKPGLFKVTTPSFTVSNPAGESFYCYADKGDGVDVTVRCVTGSLEVQGRHFTIPAMHAADAFRLRASHDELETVLYGKSGDYVVKLDRGLVMTDEIQDDGTIKQLVSHEFLDWHLSVATRVQINRAVPDIGKRLSVTMLTFDSAGTMKNHFAFSEDRPEVNTGELVSKPANSEELAKRAAEATTDSAAEDEEATDGESSEEASSESSDESESSSDEDDDF